MMRMTMRMRTRTMLLDHLEEAVTTAALSQGLGAGWDHVLLLLSHSQWELGRDHRAKQ